MNNGKLLKGVMKQGALSRECQRVNRAERLCEWIAAVGSMEEYFSHEAHLIVPAKKLSTQHTHSIITMTYTLRIVIVIKRYEYIDN